MGCKQSRNIQTLSSNSNIPRPTRSTKGSLEVINGNAVDTDFSLLPLASSFLYSSNEYIYDRLQSSLYSHSLSLKDESEKSFIQNESYNSKDTDPLIELQIKSSTRKDLNTIIESNHLESNIASMNKKKPAANSYKNSQDSIQHANIPDSLERQITTKHLLDEMVQQLTENESCAFNTTMTVNDFTTYELKEYYIPSACIVNGIVMYNLHCRESLNFTPIAKRYTEFLTLYDQLVTSNLQYANNLPEFPKAGILAYLRGPINGNTIKYRQKQFNKLLTYISHKKELASSLIFQHFLQSSVQNNFSCKTLV